MRYTVLIILGIIFILYGMFIFSAGSGTGFFLVWIALGFLTEVLAILLHSRILSPLPEIVRTGFHLVFLVFFLYFLIVMGMILSGFTGNPPEGLDFIIVPGAQVRQDGPSVVLRYRLDRAIAYLEENPETVCIVSGGQGYNEPWSEAEGMQRYLMEKGIEKGRIVTEDKSANTAQNLRNSKALLDPKHHTAGIVTNNFHMFRATWIAGRLGYETVYAVPAGSSIPYLPNNLLREFMGITKDFLIMSL